MQHTTDIHILPEKLDDPEAIRSAISHKLKIHESDITHYQILKRSIDARKKPVCYFLRVEVFVNKPYIKPEQEPFTYKTVSGNSDLIYIIGMGPAGMFAALECLRSGIKPVIIERGKQVRERRRDLAKLTREHIVDPDSNYCFGEGGAGTYSDGKLYTRSKKRGDLKAVLKTLVEFGADPDILVDSHPHIGTNKLPGIIEKIRDHIISHGGEIHFNSRLTDMQIEAGRIRQIIIDDKHSMPCQQLILATGHSARDIYELLDKRNILIEPKSFALGIRIEHPQEIIDRIQYKCKTRGDYLPPASYALVEQVNDLGVYSFCMCPGGIIAPCATRQDEVVVNGWSPSKRDNPYANSGMVVEVPLNKLDIEQYGPLTGVYFQKNIEKKAWEAAGKTQKVPAQRMIDFVNNKKSSDLPKTSYIPGIVSINLNDILPDFIAKALRTALKKFGKKMPGYYTNEAVLHAVESRTSSPVRIPRDKISLEHPEIKGLFPCGEGAGYAGGIISAAIDGIRCVKASILTVSERSQTYK